VKQVLLLLLFISFPISAATKEYGNVFIDEVTSIYDGDTFRVNINSYPKVIGHRIPVRVNGIDTPELRGKCEIEKQRARAAKQITVKTLRSAKIIELKNIQRGKYFRLIADVYADGKSLAEELINKKLAVRYSGGKKINWCE